MKLQDRYLLDTVLRACDVLEAFRADGELLRLMDVAARTGLNKSTAFRILFTLERRGLVERTANREYRLAIRPLKRRKYRIGYAAQSTEFAFSREVTDSLGRAALVEGVDLMSLNNRYSPKTAIRNAEILVRERVDLAIEFQTDEHVAPIVSARLREAGIPMIAVEIPHPGATYYGADNYRAGVIGGRYLAHWAKQRWQGAVDEVLWLELPMAGPLPRSRLTGTLIGIREVLPDVKDSQVVYLNGNGRFGPSLESVRKHLRKSRARRVLVAAINDPSAIGALRAFEEAGRVEQCAVMGQNGSLEARSEMRNPSSRLVGSVGYFPERYGEALIPLAIGILQRKPIPPAVFVKHQLLTRQNVNDFYPNDAHLSGGELDTLCMRAR